MIEPSEPTPETPDQGPPGPEERLASGEAEEDAAKSETSQTTPTPDIGTDVPSEKTSRDVGRFAPVLVALALIARLVAVLQTSVITPDGVEFVRLARAFTGGGAAEALAHRHHPLYPILVGLGHFVISDWTLAASAVSMLFGGLAAWPLYVLVARLFDRRTGLVAAGLYAFLPPFVRLGADALSDSSFHFFALTALAIAAPKKDAPLSPAGATLCGLFCALAYYVRPEGVLLPAAILAWWAAAAVLGKTDRKAGLGAAMILLFAFAGTAWPYVAHVKQATGRWDITKKKPAAHLLNVYQGEQGEATQAVTQATDLPRQSSVPGAALRVGEAVVYDLFYISFIFCLIGLLAPRGRPGLWREIYLYLPILFWLGVCLLLARSHGYLSHRHAAMAALGLLGFAARGIRVLSSWIAAAVARADAHRSRRLASRIAIALVALAAVLGSTSAFRTYRSGKVYVITIGRELKGGGADGRVILGNRVRISYYAGARHVDIPAMAHWETTVRTILDSGASFLVLDLEDPHFPVRYGPVLERFEDRNAQVPGFTFLKRWTLDDKTGRNRDIRAYKIDPESLRATLKN